MSKPNRKVIARGQLPTSFPITSTAVCWLVLDRLRPSGWVWGVAGTVLVILWLVVIYAICTEDSVELTDLKNKGKE